MTNSQALHLLLFLSVAVACALFPQAETIECFQCDSNSDLECSEMYDHSSSNLRARSCDHVTEARFCIKTTGMYGGQIGTQRNCSSRDLGDYCSYIQRPGDQRFTRSCVFTCSRDGCNGVPPSAVSATSLLLVLLTATAILLPLLTFRF